MALLDPIYRLYVCLYEVLFIWLTLRLYRLVALQEDMAIIITNTKRRRRGQSPPNSRGGGDDDTNNGK